MKFEDIKVGMRVVTNKDGAGGFKELPNGSIGTIYEKAPPGLIRIDFGFLGCWNFLSTEFCQLTFMDSITNTEKPFDKKRRYIKVIF